MIKVETDEGIYGWGEAGLPSRALAVVGTLQHFREWLIGRNPLQIGRLWQELYRSQYFEGGRVLTTAISALDIAFHDIKGKALGVPVYQLLGGKQREWIPCFATTGAPMGPELIEHATQLLEEGWPAIRTMFHMTPAVGDSSDIFEPENPSAKLPNGLQNYAKQLVLNQ